MISMRMKVIAMGNYIYTYTDYKTKEVVFQCKSETISEADLLYEKATGKNPSKQSHIGCSITSDTPDND